MGRSKDLASGNSAAYVETAGDTMTGALTVGGAVTVNPDTDSSLLIKDGGTNALFMTSATGDELYIGANNEYAIRIKSDGTKDVTFDNGSRVTMPSQPMFSASTSTHGANGVIVWDLVSSNIGSHLNTSNGRFTAPVAGNYFFTTYGMSHSGTTNIRSRFLVNNAVYSAGEHHGGVGYQAGGQYQQAVISTILPLSVNDYVSVEWQSGYASIHEQHSKFSGFLIG